MAARSPPRTPPRVVVVGGGFGGLEVCRRLARDARAGRIALTLVSKENFFQFNPLLPEVATGSVETRHVVYPLREFCARRHIRFLRNKVRSVDPVARVLSLHNDLALPYDALVVAVGSTTNYFGVPGAEANGFPFKTVMDAVRLRAHVVEMWELADQATDLETKRRLLTFVVAGGGVTGVEVCSALVRMFRDTMYRLYPSLTPDLVTVHMVDAADRLIPGLRRRHSTIAERHLREIGVHLVLGRTIQRVDPRYVYTDDDARLPAHTLIWTAGVRGVTLDAPWPWPTGPGGRLIVDPHGRVAPGVWAVGDVVSHAHDDVRAAPQVAQAAIQFGRVVAHNVRVSLSEPEGALDTFSYRDLGYFVGLGKHSTVATVLGIPIAGWLAWNLWALVYLVKMVGLRKQIEVAFDMLTSWFVGHDTCQIHERRRMLRAYDLDPDLSGPNLGRRAADRVAEPAPVEAPPGEAAPTRVPEEV